MNIPIGVFLSPSIFWRYRVYLYNTQNQIGQHLEYVYFLSKLSYCIYIIIYE